MSGQTRAKVFALMLGIAIIFLIMAGCGVTNAPGTERLAFASLTVTVPPAEFGERGFSPTTEDFVSGDPEENEIADPDHLIHIETGEELPLAPPAPPVLDEYGHPDFIIDTNGNLSANISYPVTGFYKADKTIASWAQGVYDSAKAEIAALNAYNADIMATTEVNYTSAIVHGSFACVRESGYYTHTELARPLEIIKTFNMDINTGKLLDYDDILDKSREASVLALLRWKILVRHPDWEDSLDRIDAGWSANLALDDDGLDVIIPRGKLPEQGAPLTIRLSYAELGKAFILWKTPENSAPDPTNEPRPGELG